MNQYQKELKDLINPYTCIDGYRFLLDSIVKPILQRNPDYPKKLAKGTSAGIILVIEEFDSFVDGGPTPTDEHKRLFGELAYQFWLLGSRFRSTHESALQKRISEFAKGAGYYDGGKAGFRQFEYEVQGMCRLVEEGLGFHENLQANQPDLTVTEPPSDFQLEFKLPTTNVATSLKKALSQIGSRSGVVVISLDSVLAPKDPANFEAGARKHAQDARQLLGTRRNITVFFEWYSSRGGARNGRVEWFGNPLDRHPLETIWRALRDPSSHSDHPPGAFV